MTTIERKAEWQKQTQGSVELARNTVDNLLRWSQFVSEDELSTKDHAAVLEALWGLYRVMQPINERYLDGPIAVTEALREKSLLVH